MQSQSLPKEKHQEEAPHAFSWVWLVTLTLFLLVPEVWLAHSHPWYEPIVSIVFNAYNYLAIVLSVMLLCAYIGTIGRIIKGLFAIIVTAYSVSQSFLWFNFYRHWDQFTLLLVNETTTRESSEFLASYLFSPASLIVMFFYTMVVVASIVVDKNIRSITLPRNKWLRSSIFIYIMTVYSQVYFLAGSLQENYDRAAGWPVKRTAIFNLRQSILQMKDTNEEFTLCAQTMQNYAYEDSIPNEAPDIVWIIGESYNRHHAALYGYDLMTTPNLYRRYKKGQLYRFDNVIAPDNGTSICFKAFMSFASSNDSIKWYERPLLPAIFKKQGWNVVYYSNQFTIKDDLAQWDASMGFLNHPKISEHLFTTRNHSTYGYDGQLIDDYILHRNKLEKANHNFIIFHLYGQHVDFSSRFPSVYAKFSENEIKRPDCTAQQKEVIAQYDNATLYNDEVIERIIRMFENRNAIIIYFADHGEEIHDFRNHLGRTSLDKDDERALNQQLDIPFVIIPTTKCLASHPELNLRLSRSLNNAFMTDDFPHMLLDLINVSSTLLDKKKSLISDQYHTSKRYIKNAAKYYDN